MPELNFKGKEFVYNHHLTVPFRPLEVHPDKGVGEPSLDGNLIIHGDNLHGLKALLPTHAGKVDCIFIDPPYNTGNEGWCYNDNVNSPMIKEWLSDNPVGVEDGLRHDKWLAMMWPRLRLLWELLKPGGNLLISIGDNELHRLKIMADDLFGEDAFVTEFVWKSRASEDTRAESGISNDHEFVLVLSKPPRRRMTGASLDESKFANPDNDPRGPWRSADMTGLASRDQRPNLHYDITDPETGNTYPCPPRGWRFSQEEMRRRILDSRIIWPNSSDGRPRQKLFRADLSRETKNVSSIIESFKTGDGTREIERIFGERAFDFPKPSSLIQFLLDQAADRDGIILDSFAGSGTTAHAVLAANARDGGNRRFILIEGEDYADGLTAERVRRVINGYGFIGTQREILHSELITLSKLRESNSFLEKISQITILDGPRYDRIKTTVKDGSLIISGERDCSEVVPGLGDTFTYCTLGDPIDMDGLLTGDDLPAPEGLAALLYHTATSQAFDQSKLKPEPAIGDGVMRLGDANGRHLWLIYKPNLEWLKSGEAALTLSRARAIAAAETGDHLVFAPAKFVSRELLTQERLPVEYAPLPFALYRVETA